MWRIWRLLRHKGGNTTPMTIAIVLGMLLIICAAAEFFRLSIIVGGIRDGLQQAVIGVAVTNYDETYHGLREGYSGGYTLVDGAWQEQLNYVDVYEHLDELIGTEKDGQYHVKTQGIGYEFRLSGLRMELLNPQLAPADSGQNFEVDARITVEIPLSFGWDMVPPLVMEIRTRAEYMPKF